MIDYVITRQRDIKDVEQTRAMCGSSVWSDHKVVRSKLALRAKIPQLRHRIKPRRKPDVAKLKSAEVRSLLAEKLKAALEAANIPGPTSKAS